MAAILREIASIIRNTNGSVVTYAALALPIIVGAVGLSVDVTSWQVNRRTVQSASDSAAVAAALEIMRLGNETAILTAATLDAGYNGYNPVSGDAIDVYHPPISGIALGSTDAVEIVITRSAPTFLSSLFLDGPVAISGRAVARVQINDTCVWALSPDARGAIKVSGGAQVNMGCGIIANSVDTESLSQDGSSCLTATKIKLAGGYDGQCVNPEPLTNILPVNDPLASLQPPSYGGCDHTAKTKINGGEVVTLSPGVYCANIEVVSDGVVNFEPGLYVLDGAGLSVSAQGTATGTGLNFYLTENSGTANSITLQANATVTLTAATTGPLAGILFYHNADSLGNVTHNLTGGASMDLEGILYFPGQDVSFAGDSTFNASASMLIAQTITFTGNTEMGDFSDSAVAANNMLISAVIIE
ncbi:MAG: pilus assembly protein TadG-related protein [Alphaproteobacteria bacterium]